MRRIFVVGKKRALLRTIIDGHPHLATIVQAIHDAGGRALLVGGAVRDLYLGRAFKDLDIEVYGLSLSALEKVLKRFGPVSQVGKSFGVLRLHTLDIDWALPRRDSRGRKPAVKIDPNMPYKDAFARRDLTINAMGLDLVTYELIDPFNGLRDLKEKKLRTPDSNRFIEDPLRFYRVVQCVGRFEMKPDRVLEQLCKTMSLRGVSRERVEMEYAKLLLQSARPSLGIEWLRRIGRLEELLPELAALRHVAQDSIWHPEGDAYIHTLQVLDAAAGMHYHSSKEKLIAMWTALGHDLGKATCSQKKPDGRISAHGHEMASVPLVKKLLKRITRDRELLLGVCTIVRYHMCPGQFIAHKAKPAAYKRLAAKLAAPVTLELLGTFACADKRGRNPKGSAPLARGAAMERAFLRKAKELNVLRSVEKPILLGRDLLDVMPPGPEMGRVLKKAYALQLERGITDKNTLKQMVLKKL